MPATAQSANDSAPPNAFQDALAAYDQAWDASGLALNTVTFTDGAGSGYGQYTPRADAVFAGDETLSVYVEPVGYAFKESGAGFAYDLTASYKLLNKSGQVLAEQENFATFSGAGRSKQRELGASFSFQFSGLPAGDYKLEARLADKVNGKQAHFTLPFTISSSE